MGKTTSFLAVALLASAFCADMDSVALAAGHSNPVDQLSNPGALDFTDVEVSPGNLNKAFVRDGALIGPGVFATIKPGLAQADIRSTLGEPLRQHNARGLMWSYNFKFKLPQSQNYLVCQYEVMFDEQLLVSDAVWRRRQCQQLAGSEAAAM